MRTPLISVLVVTYNSARFVLDTLDSVRDQTYRNVELIISDDGSKDDTVHRCQKWLSDNDHFFIRSQLISVNVNTGIPSNCNRGLQACNGEWVKLIAGDDMLTDNCIQSLVDSISDDKDVIIGQIRRFSEKEGKIVYGERLMPSEGIHFFFHQTASFQHNYMLLQRPGFAAGAFIRRNLYDRVCYYDERYKLMEDLPFWLNITKSGIRIHLLENVVALYRTHDSVSIVNDEKFINENFHKCTQQFVHEVLNKEISWYHLAYWESYYVDQLKFWLIIRLFNNKVNWFNRLVVKAFNAVRLAPYSNSLKNHIYQIVYS